MPDIAKIKYRSFVERKKLEIEELERIIIAHDKDLPNAVKDSLYKKVEILKKQLSNISRQFKQVYN